MPIVFTLSPLFFIKDHLCGIIPALSTHGKAPACRKSCKLPYTKLSNPVPFEFRRFWMMFFLRRPYIEILLKPLKVHAAPVILYHNFIFSAKSPFSIYEYTVIYTVIQGSAFPYINYLPVYNIIYQIVIRSG